MKNNAVQRFTIVSSVFASVLMLANIGRAQCDLYPIALSAQTVANVAPGAVINDILNGTQPGNFGWLTWTGNPSEPTLVQSLTSGGDSYTYVNPFAPGNNQITAGVWIQGKPGVSNGKAVHDALSALEGQVITVPIWDVSIAQGNNSLYEIVGFAQVQITNFQLLGQNRISVLFIGFTSCGLAD
ncbi:MAG: hypothetical protein ABSA45_05635 [Verrucomicrobiota bacterium]